MKKACGIEVSVQKKTIASKSVVEKVVAENRRMAKKVHKALCLHALFGLLDGFSCSVSTIRYGFDVLYTESPLNAPDMMHEWLTTPAGMAVAASETVFIVAFSMLGNLLDDKDNTAFKRYIAVLWPYCRDTMKGLKNAYKGMRSTLQVLGTLSGQDFRYLIVPVGLVLGVLSVMNRLFLRSMRAKRMVMQAANNELLLELQASCRFYSGPTVPDNLENYKNSYILVGEGLHYVSPYGHIENVDIKNFKTFLSDLQKLSEKKDKNKPLYLSKNSTYELITSNGGHRPVEAFVTDASCKDISSREIGLQSSGLRSVALLSAAYGGVVDGLYLYMGAMGLAALAPPVFTVMMVFSTIFALTCVATRVYEEYDYQRDLVRTQLRVELAQQGKKLELLFSQLQGLSKHFSKGLFVSTLGVSLLTEQQEKMSALELEDEQKKILQEIELEMKEFDAKKMVLDAQLRISYQSVALAGLKNGLAAYGAIASLMFAVAVINLILFVPFSPVFLVAGMVAGMACLIGFLGHALITHHLCQPEEKQSGSESNATISEFLSSLRKMQAGVEALKPAEVKEAILEGMPPDPSPQFPVQEILEILRATCTGVKGQKTIDYLLNQYQESDGQGHYHDTPIMLWLAVFTSAIYSMVLGLRAYGRGFGRKAENEEIDKAKADEIVEMVSEGVEPQSPLEPSNIDSALVIDMTLAMPDGGVGSSVGPQSEKRALSSYDFLVSGLVSGVELLSPGDIDTKKKEKQLPVVGLGDGFNLQSRWRSLKSKTPPIIDSPFGFFSSLSSSSSPSYPTCHVGPAPL